MNSLLALVEFLVTGMLKLLEFVKFESVRLLGTSSFVAFFTTELSALLLLTEMIVVLVVLRPTLELVSVLFSGSEVVAFKFYDELVSGKVRLLIKFNASIREVLLLRISSSIRSLISCKQSSLELIMPRLVNLVVSLNPQRPIKEFSILKLILDSGDF